MAGAVPLHIRPHPGVYERAVRVCCMLCAYFIPKHVCARVCMRARACAVCGQGCISPHTTDPGPYSCACVCGCRSWAVVEWGCKFLRECGLRGALFVGGKRPVCSRSLLGFRGTNLGGHEELPAQTKPTPPPFPPNKTKQVVVSHSQDFLNGVCTNILHLTTKKTLAVYGGNYVCGVKSQNAYFRLLAVDFALLPMLELSIFFAMSRDDSFFGPNPLFRFAAPISQCSDAGRRLIERADYVCIENSPRQSPFSSSISPRVVRILRFSCEGSSFPAFDCSLT